MKNLFSKELGFEVEQLRLNISLTGVCIENTYLDRRLINIKLSFKEILLQLFSLDYPRDVSLILLHFKYGRDLLNRAIVIRFRLDIFWRTVVNIVKYKQKIKETNINSILVYRERGTKKIKKIIKRGV